MAETELFSESEILKAVETYVYQRHQGLTPHNVQGWNEEELARVTTTDGYLDFTVGDLEIKERDDEDEGPIWYVSATLYFQTEREPIVSDPETYECYRCGEEWCIQWDSC